MTQTFFPGTEPPDQNPAVQEAVDAWREAKRECRRTREARDVKHAALLALMQEHKLETFSFIDELTGKKRRIRIETVTKAKDGVAPREQPAEDDSDDSFIMEAPIDDKVEKRRVSRSSVEKEIDGFAATRDSMETH